MICKHCQQELPEDSRFCHHCGQPIGEDAEQTVALPDEPELLADETVILSDETVVLADEAEAPAQEEPAVGQAEPASGKKSRTWLLVLGIIGGIAIFAVLVCALLYAVLTSLGINVKFWENDLQSQSVYTVTDDEAAKKASQVVATVADRELTNGELQIYYWETVYNFLNNNYYYLSYYGLDTTVPLDEQTYIGDETMTWQQYFLEQALSTWQRYTTLQLLAQDAGYVLDEETQTMLDEFPTSLQETVTAAGFDNAQDWLTENCGPGVTEQGYTNYVHAYYEGLSYLYSRYEELEPTDDEVAAYFTENEETFASSGVTLDGGNYYDVRHILIEVESAAETEETDETDETDETEETTELTYTDADWETCRVEAQLLLDQFLASDASEDTFATMATLYSADTGSSSNGGLYTQLTSDTSFVQEFKDWYLDESRQPGDTGLVKSTYGYHVMYFSGSQPIWQYTAAEQLLSERISGMIDTGMEQYPMSVNYKKIILGTKETL